MASSSRITSVKAEGSSSTALSLTNATEAAKLSKPGPRHLPLGIPVLNSAVFDLNALDAAIEAISLGEDVFTFDPYLAMAPHSSQHQARATRSSQAHDPPRPPHSRLCNCFSTKSGITNTAVLTSLLRVLRIHDPDAILPTMASSSASEAPCLIRPSRATLAD